MFDFQSIADLALVSKEMYQRRARVYEPCERVPTSEQDARLALVSGLTLRSLRRDGAGTVDDFVKRLGIDSDEVEGALASLVSLREARALRKPFGILYAPPKVDDDGFPPGTEYAVVGSKSLPIFKDPRVDRYERVESDSCIAAIARFFATTGVDLCTSLTLSNATGYGRPTVAATLRTLAQKGLVKSAPFAEKRSPFSYTEVSAWRVLDRVALHRLFDGGETSAPAPFEKSLYGAALREQILTLLQTRPARYREIIAAFPKCNPRAVESAVRTLRNNGLIERGEEWHGKWRAVKDAPKPPQPPKPVREERSPYYGVARATVEEVYLRVAKSGAEGVLMSDLCDEFLSYATAFRAIGALVADGRLRRDKTRETRCYRYYAR